MKSQTLKYAGLVLAIAMALTVTDSASASNKKSGKNSRNDCRSGRGYDYGRGGHHDRDCGDDEDDTGGSEEVSGSIGIVPVGTVVITDTVLSIMAPYTAPADSDAVVTLLQNGVAVGTFTVPAGTSAGSATFTAVVAPFSTTVFQAELSYVSSSGSGDDDCYGGGHHGGKRSKGCRPHSCGGGDDDDGGSTTVTLLSDTLTVIQDGGVSND